jgi:hypothetical protein
MQQKIWIADIIETDDGTGDAILQFPDDFMTEVGWKEGTELNLKLEETPTGNVLIITEKK